jgi:hypothetical protein
MNPLGIAGSVLGIVDKFIPDPVAKAEILKEITKLETDVALKQIDNNIAEAGSGSWWTSGWRPAIGWVCAAALAYAIIGRDILMVAGSALGIDPGIVPVFDTTLLETVLYGLLGLGAMRTYEKVKGAQ